MDNRRYRRKRKRDLPEWLGSNRKGHMVAAISTGAALLIITLLTQWMWVLPFTIGVPAWEWACTPDVDITSKRRPKGLIWSAICKAWLPYSWLVPHRSRYSHSLVFGTTCRLTYVLVIVLTIVFAIAALFGELSTVLDMLKIHWKIILANAAIADVVHLFKDGYNIKEMILGKG